MITRAPLIIPPNGAIFLPAAQPSGVGTEKGGRRERSFVWLESGIAQIQFHRRERDPVRSSARSSFHKHIYRRLDALQWRFNLANAFCALWPAGLSLSFYLFLSFYPLPILPRVRRWFARFFSFSVFLTEAGWWSELFPSRATRSRQSRSVSSQKTDFFFFFFGNESLFHWTFSGVSFFLFFCFCLMYRIKVV